MPEKGAVPYRYDPAPLRFSEPKQRKADLGNATEAALLSSALHRLGPAHLSSAAETGRALRGLYKAQAYSVRV